MADPAIEAAKRVDAMCQAGRLYLDSGSTSKEVAAAREMAKPIRAWFDWWSGEMCTRGMQQAVGEIAQLLYTSEELE